MKQLFVIAAMTLAPTVALAEGPKLPAVDMNKSITLTLAELQALIAAERAQVVAAPALEKLQAVVNAGRISAPPSK